MIAALEIVLTVFVLFFVYLGFKLFGKSLSSSVNELNKEGDSRDLDQTESIEHLKQSIEKALRKIN